MHFIKTLTAVVAAAAGLAAATPVPATPLERRAGGNVCADANFEPVTSVGNSSGTPFCESRWGTTYLPITTITTWSDSSYVLAIQVTYSDGSLSQIYGNTTGLTEMSIGVNYANASNDVFTSLALYKYSFYPYINSLYVTIKNGSTMNAGESIYFYPTEYPQNVGSGILYGINGTIDPDNGNLNSLGFEFLDSAISSIDVTNFNFGNNPSGDEDILPNTVDSAHYYNNQSQGNETWLFSNTYTTTVTHTFTQTYAETFTGMEAIDVGYNGMMPVPITATSTTTFGWSFEAMQAYEDTNTTTKDLNWSEGGDLEPHKGVDCVAVVGVGSGSFPYNATVTVNLQNGKSFSFPEAGTLTLYDVTAVAVQCSEDDRSF